MKLTEVEDTEESLEVAKEGKKFILVTSIKVIIFIILTGVGIYVLKNDIGNKHKTEEKKSPIIAEEIKPEPIKNNKPSSDINDNISAGTENINNNVEEIANTVISTNDTIADATLADDSIVNFYKDIEEKRTKYGQDFADVFQNEADIEDFKSFINGFNPLVEQTSSMESFDQFDHIINSYYKSCIKYGVTPNLGSLLTDNPAMSHVLAQSEALAGNLVNGKGNDYTIPNKYYIYLAENLIDEQGSSLNVKVNAPYVYIILKQYEQYRNVGNMLEARKYQKVYDIEINGSKEFACPDGIDNFLISDVNYGTIPTYKAVMDFISEEFLKLERNN